jgi:hypothetical protein
MAACFCSNFQLETLLTRNREQDKNGNIYFNIKYLSAIWATGALLQKCTICIFSSFLSWLYRSTIILNLNIKTRETPSIQWAGYPERESRVKSYRVLGGESPAFDFIYPENIAGNVPVKPI